MVLDFEYVNGKLIISEINEKGKIAFNYYPWKNPKKFEETTSDDPDKHPRFHTWDGNPVKLTPCVRPDRFSIYEFIDRLPQEERDRLFAFHEPDIYFIDIETEIILEEGNEGFVEPTDATSAVQTIAIVYNNKCRVIGLKDLDEGDEEIIEKQITDHFEGFDIAMDFKYKSFAKFAEPEKAMLKYFFEKLVPKMPVMTGWNFLNYDWTFLINRYRRLGFNPACASPTSKLYKIFMTDYEVPYHRFIIDYMELYKKWDTTIKVKEANSLNWVGGKLLKMDHAAKVSYSGSLQELYNQDFRKYVFYNAVDTVLVQLIHLKKQYLNIAYSTACLAKIKLNDFAFKNLNTTLVQTEGILRNRFRDEYDIVLTKKNSMPMTDSYEGGWVKPPRVGLNEWVACFDFASLYPTTQRQFKIAPENFKGFVDKTDMRYAVFSHNKRFLIEKGDIVCNNGAVFRNEDGPTIKFLAEVYSDRKAEKAKMKDKYKEIDKLNKEIDELEKELELEMMK